MSRLGLEPTLCWPDTQIVKFGALKPFDQDIPNRWKYFSLQTVLNSCFPQIQAYSSKVKEMSSLLCRSKTPVCRPGWTKVRHRIENWRSSRWKSCHLRSKVSINKNMYILFFRQYKLERGYEPLRAKIKLWGSWPLMMIRRLTNHTWIWRDCPRKIVHGNRRELSHPYVHRRGSSRNSGEYIMFVSTTLAYNGVGVRTWIRWAWTSDVTLRGWNSQRSTLKADVITQNNSSHKTYLVTSNGELLTVKHIVRNGSLWSNVVFEKEVIFH